MPEQGGKTRDQSKRASEADIERRPAQTEGRGGERGAENIEAEDVAQATVEGLSPTGANVEEEE